MVEAHLILGFDGTAQSADQSIKSNTHKIIECAEDQIESSGNVQKSYYYEGVGSQQRSMIHRGIHQWGGFGVKDIFLRGYRDMCEFAAEHRDKTIKISLLGFSRGFFIALMLRKAKHKVGLLDFDQIAKDRGQGELSDTEKGKLCEEVWRLYHSKRKPSDPDMVAFRKENSYPESLDFYLYAFDPVGQFFRYRLKDEQGDEFTLHDAKLPFGTKAYIEILAQDEQRRAYKVMPVWAPDHYDILRRTIICPGDHCCIGGSKSKKREPLADIAGLEMLLQMQEISGVKFNETRISWLFNPDPLACLDDNFDEAEFQERMSMWLTRQYNGVGPRDFPKDAILHYSTQERMTLRQGRDGVCIGLEIADVSSPRPYVQPALEG